MVHGQVAWAALLSLSGLVGLSRGAQQHPTAQVHLDSKAVENLPSLISPLTIEEQFGHPACDTSCNGDKLHSNPYSDHMRTCWGTLKTRCYMEKKDYNATVDYNCEGAFTFTPVWNSAGTHVHTLACEGAMSTVSGVTGDVCPEGTCLTGSLCLSNSLIIRADSEGYQEQASYCNQFAAYGSALKTDNTAADKAGRKGWLHDDEDSDIVEIFLHSLSEDLPTGLLVQRSASKESSILLDTAEAVHEGAPDAANLNPMLMNILMMKTAGGKEEYTHTCNGRKIHKWLSWWPCWGVLEFKNRFADDQVMFELRAECRGFSIPKFRICKGFSTVHSKSKGPLREKVVSTESMEVTNGKKRTVRRIGSDWALEVTRVKGPTSVHSRLLGLEAEPPEDVKAAVATIMNYETKGDFQGA